MATEHHGTAASSSEQGGATSATVAPRPRVQVRPHGREPGTRPHAASLRGSWLIG
jgi:hypothetical protein